MSCSSRNDIIHNKEIFVILHFEIKSSSPKDKLLIILVVTLYYCIHVTSLVQIVVFTLFVHLFVFYSLSNRETHCSCSSRSNLMKMHILSS